jgi:membrane glycosyltransferase
LCAILVAQLNPRPIPEDQKRMTPALMLGAAYLIPVVYAPVLMMTHSICVFFFIFGLIKPNAMSQPQRRDAR